MFNLIVNVMFVDDETLVNQEAWAEEVLAKIAVETEEEQNLSERNFVDCIWGCSGSCTGCEGTTHCGNTYDD